MRHFISAGLALSAITLVLASSQAARAQVFSQPFGATGALTGPGSTQYTLGAGGSGNSAPGTYSVVTNANQLNSNFLSLTGAGSFLVFDSATTPLNVFSTGNVALTAGQSYTFSFLGASVFTSSFPTLQASYVNPASQTTVLGNLNLTQAGVFTQFSQTFTALTAGNYVFNIVNTNTAAGGNDGAIDTVTVTAVAPEPGSALLLVPGLLGLVGVVRRRRK